jgi:long-chain fatty acid transport protein
MRQRLLAVCGVLLAGSLAAGDAFAQGSSVYSQSACVSGRAGTAVANPCGDGSAILYNPAAVALRPGAISAGYTGIRTSHTFTYDFTGQQVARDPSIVSVPQGYLTARLGNLGLGVGVFAPYGGSIDWPLEFEGRFVTYDQTLRAIYIQPTAAFAIVPGALSIGAGLTYVRANIDLTQRADMADVGLPGTPLSFANFGIPRGTDFADVNLAGSGSGTSFHLGVLLEPTEWISVGARYMHRVTTDLEGDATFTPVPTGLVVAPGSPFAGPPFNVPVGQPVDLLLAQQFQAGGALADQGVQTSVTWPEQAVLGLHVRPLRNLSLLGDYQYFKWSRFDRFPVHFQEAGQDTELVLNFQNAQTWRLGADFGVTEALNLRAGYIYNTAASPEGSVSPFLPEGERNYYTAGIGYRLPMGLQIDAFYQYIDQDVRRGRVRTPLPGQDPVAANLGIYTLDSAHLLGFTLALQPRFLNR